MHRNICTARKALVSRIEQKLFGKLIVLLLLSCILQSCSDFSTERAYIHNRTVPKTDAEIEFINELKRMGYSNVKYAIPIVGRGHSGNCVYRITMTSEIDLSEILVDSIVARKYRIADYLYSNVISDSVMCEINRIDVAIKFKDRDQIRIKDPRYFEVIKKSDLEMRNGFRIVKEKGKYNKEIRSSSYRTHSFKKT